MVVDLAFGVSIEVATGLVVSAVHCPTPSADTIMEFEEQDKVVLGVIISVLGLKLAASNK